MGVVVGVCPHAGDTAACDCFSYEYVVLPTQPSLTVGTQGYTYDVQAEAEKPPTGDPAPTDVQD